MRLMPPPLWTKEPRCVSVYVRKCLGDERFIGLLQGWRKRFDRYIRWRSGFQFLLQFIDEVIFERLRWQGRHRHTPRTVIKRGIHDEARRIPCFLTRKEVSKRRSI